MKNSVFGCGSGQPWRAVAVGGAAAAPLRRCACVVIAVLAMPGPVTGQAVLPHTVSARPAFNTTVALPRPAAVASSSAMATSGGQAFAIEAAGAVAGSLLGFSAIYLTGDRCDVEDLSCNLESVFGGIVLGTAGATAGAWLAGRAGDTDPSLAGAAIGSVVGVGAGIGLWHLFTEELDVVNKPFAAALTYSVAQGVTTALGSRLARRLRR